MARDTAHRVRCNCGCNEMVAPATAWRHRHGQAPMSARVASAEAQELPNTFRGALSTLANRVSVPVRALGQRFARRHQRGFANTTVTDGAGVAKTGAATSVLDVPMEEPSMAVFPTQSGSSSISHDPAVDSNTPEMIAEAAIAGAQQRIWAGRTRAARVDDASDDEDDGELNNSEPAVELNVAWDDAPINENGAEDPYDAISSWDRVQEYWLKATGNLRMLLLLVLRTNADHFCFVPGPSLPIRQSPI
ncbi:hypothetical protein BC629DRAFT_1064818 [Irpex lacteus]|nr:hypothetical protein BC629DRAFT_1064818 [Irpex lacteus]